MSATHAGHAHTHAHNARRADPTGTKTRRDRFASDLSGRLRRVKGLIRATVGYQNDALGLSANADAVDTFDFPTDAENERAFMRWLKRALADEFLEPANFVGVRGGRHYTATYVRASYAKAVQDAGRRLRSEGFDAPDQDLETIFNLPTSETSLRRLYTRTYENLKGIDAHTADVIRRELTQGFAEGVNPRTMASRMNAEVDTINLTRARVLARTETIHAYSEGTLDRYQQLGVGKVNLKAEWLTAGDRRVCPACASREGDILTVEEARGVIPLHPSCRCTWTPAVS